MAAVSSRSITILLPGYSLPRMAVIDISCGVGLGVAAGVGVSVGAGVPVGSAVTDRSTSGTSPPPCSGNPRVGAWQDASRLTRTSKKMMFFIRVSL
ncbi:MAG: hypothetical protein AB9891_12010 [Anaerolineaceae bacterium]